MTQGRYTAQQIEAFAQKALTDGWLFRPEVSIRIPRAALDTLSPRGRHLLRFNPIVESLEADGTEAYRAFAY